MDDKEQQNYLSDHLPYMLASVRYTRARLSVGCRFRDWNAYFESFAVNARNLVEFLSNGDKGNARACDFVRDFKHRKGDISGPMRKLDQQVFHLHVGRPVCADGKFNIDMVVVVQKWIEDGMEQFLSGLSPEQTGYWNAIKANPDLDELQTPSTIRFGPTGPGTQSTSTASPMIATTASSSIVGTDVSKTDR